MIEVFYRTVHHYFPKLSIWLNNIDDPRVKKNYIYPVPSFMDGNISVSCKTGCKKTDKVSSLHRGI